MRTIEDVRNRLLETLHGALTRPGMYGGDQHGVQMVLTNLLDDLTYIDERESELARAYAILKGRGMWTATGFIGAFCQQFSCVDAFSNEIASVFAEISHGFGYVKVDRTLTNTEWKDIRKKSREICSERDWRVSQIKDRFGDPSWVIGGWMNRVHCYASTSTDGWVFLISHTKLFPTTPIAYSEM